MPFPAFDPDVGGRQGIDANSKRAFALNSHAWTVSIEAAAWGNNGVDFQYAPDGKTWASILLPRGPVKRVHCQHFIALTGAYRFVTDGAVGVIAEITSP